MIASVLLPPDVDQCHTIKHTQLSCTIFVHICAYSCLFPQIPGYSMRPRTLAMIERWSLQALDHVSPKVLGRVMWNFARYGHPSLLCCCCCSDTSSWVFACIYTKKYNMKLGMSPIYSCMHPINRVNYQPSAEWIQVHNQASLKVIPHMNVATLTCAITAWRLLPQPTKPSPCARVL